MKKTLLLLLIPVLGLVACKKNNEPNCVPQVVNVTAPFPEISALRGFLSGSSVVATEDPRGFFYVLTNPGSAEKPTTCSNITLDYTLKLTDGTSVDAGNNVTFALGGLITGWQEALPLLGTGGTMTLYLPPSLGYGPSANGSIPANSMLIFTIALKAVN